MLGDQIPRRAKWYRAEMTVEDLQRTPLRVVGFYLYRCGEGWKLVFKCGVNFFGVVVSEKTRKVRVFKTAEAAIRVVDELGRRKMTVVLDQPETFEASVRPGALKSMALPDVATSAVAAGAADSWQTAIAMMKTERSQN